jgi:hypothetical protein
MLRALAMSVILILHRSGRRPRATREAADPSTFKGRMALHGTLKGGGRRRLVTPAEQTCKRLAAMGVPRSMVAELTGIDLARLSDATAEEASRLAGLTNLTQVYHDIAMGGRDAYASLRDAVESAATLGVLYEPPCMTLARLSERASWERAAWALASRRLEVWRTPTDGALTASHLTLTRRG